MVVGPWPLVLRPKAAGFTLIEVMLALAILAMAVVVVLDQRVDVVREAAMARDARKLLDGGYELQSLRAFDLFPNTAHVETLGVFDRS